MSMMIDTKSKAGYIKDVAIYIRKSRGEEEDLEKHRADLVELCEERGWRYREFAEVGTSQDIESRPAVQALLKEIEDDMFDAVVVIERDRLSRKDVGQSQINDTLRRNDVLVVTPYKTIDLNNENDMLTADIEDLLARYEYRTITRRFQRGKKRGAKNGEWTNGAPPFPYYYVPKEERNEKGESLEVDEEKAEVYKYMTKEFLKGRSTYDIAWELNKEGIKSPKGGHWNDITVRRLLEDETHLGRIISGKTEGSGHVKKITKPLVKKPREEWTIVNNCHKALKTLDQHEKILESFKKRKRSYRRLGKLPLHSLIKCGICGRTMSLNRKNNGNHNIKPCPKRHPDGTYCENRGGTTNILIDEVNRQLEMFRDDIEKNIRNEAKENSLYEKVKKQISKKEEQIDYIYNTELENHKKLALSGYFEAKEAKMEKDKLLDKVKVLEDEIHDLQKQFTNTETMTNEDRIKAIDRFFEKVKSNEVADSDLNLAYKSILDSIEWKRVDEEVEVSINFL